MYCSSITRENQALFVLLIDQSGSMDEKVTINKRVTTKAEFVATVVNTMISELVNRCRREEGIRDYFKIVAIGYQDNHIRPLIGNSFEPVTPSQLHSLDTPRRNHMEERRLANGNTIIGNFEQTLWIKPYSGGNTPMYEAMIQAHNILSRWTSDIRNRASFPPVVINISDGEATDADQNRLIELATGIKKLSTEDGSTLLLNIHITNNPGSERAAFPCCIEELPTDRNAHTLYEMSSPMPTIYNEHILEVRPDKNLSSPFRGITYNTPVTELVAMMNIGSASVNLMQ